MGLLDIGRLEPLVRRALTQATQGHDDEVSNRAPGALDEQRMFNPPPR
jgi:hypothetical protein